MDVQNNRLGLPRLNDKHIVSAIPITLIDVLWPQMEPFIQRVVDIAPDEISLEIIYNRAMRGEVLLTTVSIGTEITAVVTLEVREFDTGHKALYLPLVGGDGIFEYMAQYIEVAEAIAKDFGCTELRGLAARKGWLRSLRDHGWVEVHTTIRRKVGD